MAQELYRRAKRAEARAARDDDRRRIRLEFFRDTLTAGLGSLRVLHEGGASGLASVQGHARLIDGILQALFRLAAADAVAQGLAPSPVVLVALGGYGRAELHPSSDIDVMVIHDGDLSPFVQRITQEILYTLWDLGLQVAVVDHHHVDVRRRVELGAAVAAQRDEDDRARGEPRSEERRVGKEGRRRACSCR